jgi:transcriptional regulator
MSKKMSRKFICEECKTGFTTKYNLTRHVGTSKCNKQLRDLIESRTPTTNLSSDSQTLIEHYMNISCNPNITQFKDIHSSSKKTRSRKSILTGDIKTSVVFDVTTGDVLTELILTVAKDALSGTINVTYGGQTLIEMTLHELYHISRILHTTSTETHVHISLLRLLVNNCLPICSADLTIKYSNQEACVLQYTAEVAYLTESERKRFITSPVEMLINQYDHCSQITTEIETRYPVADIFCVHYKSDIIEVIFNQQKLISSSNPLYNLSPSCDDFELKLFTSDLQRNNARLKVDDWDAFYPKGKHSISASSRFK